ncbi:tripartite tricarboxylate transporter TctB family protein [Defluviimonas sp. SAOS-178_SWC]|uniref:tripartite tricarboxylate transporter TctB family protein n=1 Tax=Defluviimonas sp. SAOS-178_SWC TaxID=3121287 RepID=UPI0032221DE3
MTTTTRDAIFAALALGIALAIGLTAFGYPVGSSYFPRSLAVFMGVMSVIYGFRVWRGAAGAEPVTGVGAGAAFVAFAAIAVCALGMKVIGYEVTTFLFLFGLILTLGGRQRLVASLAVAAGATAALHVIFFVLLGVARPESLFF